MVSWLLRKMKSIFLIAALGGPALAAYMWWDGERIKDVEARGVEAVATIEGATRKKGRRSSTHYEVNLAWQDGSGQKRSAEGLSISNAFASRIITGDHLIRKSVRIKYLSDDTATDPILIDDAQHQAKTDQELVWAGAGAGVVGWIGALIFFLTGRRKKETEAA